MNLPKYIKVGSGMVRTSSIIAIDKLPDSDTYLVSVLDADVSLVGSQLKIRTINHEEADKLMSTLELYIG